MAGRLKTRMLKAKLDVIGIDKVLEQIADGKSLKACAAEIGIDRTLVSRVLNSPEHADKLREARRLSASVLADSCLEIAEQADPLTEKVAKLNISTRQWLASKYDKEQFGDTQNQVNISIGSLHMEALRATHQQLAPTTALCLAPNLAHAQQQAQQQASIASRARDTPVLSTTCEQVDSDKQ